MSDRTKKSDRSFLDWDSIREAEGFKVGDRVRCRGAAVGVIRNLILASPGRMRARVHWPTVPFECEGYISQNGSEQFIDLADLKHAPPDAEPVQPPAQLELV
jgi:hypothetical protein